VKRDIEVETTSEGSYFIMEAGLRILVEPGVMLRTHDGSWFWLTEREYDITISETQVTFASKSGSGMVWPYQRHSLDQIYRVTQEGESLNGRLIQ
jgi:hypothetical protein